MPLVVLHWTTVTMGRLLRRWMALPSARHVLRGLPVLLIFGIAGIYSTYQYLRAEDIRANLALRYHEAASVAAAAKKYEESRVYYDRLLSLEGETPDVLLALARVLRQLEDAVRFDAVMNDLAPIDSPRYAPGHVLRAQTLLEQDTPTVIPLVEAQLFYALKLDPQNTEAHVLLAQLYFEAGRYPDVITHLKPHIDDAPSELLMLAKACVAERQTEEAFYYGRQAVTYFHQTLQRTPYDLRARIQLAEALVFLQNFSQAAQILEQGLSVAADDEDLKTALARVHIAWSDYLERQGQRAEQVEHLQAAVAANPNELLTFQRIVNVMHGGGDAALSLRDFLQELLTSGRAVALSHLILGTDAGNRSDNRLAAYHLDLAFRSDERLLVAGNNLAYILIQQQPPDPDRALTLIEAVLEKVPGNLEFQHTRGLILTKLSRWQEAVTDLEATLPAKSDPETHSALAEAYEGLGVTDLARKHRMEATRLTSTDGGGEN